jgi:hypothetical protein
MFAKISASVVLGAALMVGAVGCESSGESAATREMNANLAKQDKLKREGQTLVAEGSGQRERGVTLRQQGVTVEGARNIAEGDGKIAEGRAMIDQAERRREEILRQYGRQPSPPEEPTAMPAGATQTPEQSP